MCTFVNQAQVMVCDVSRERVRNAVELALPGLVTAEAVHGEGTLFTCLDESRSATFQATVEQAIAGA
jgi:hypothetical protein